MIREKVAIVGTGSWGTALSALLAWNDYSVALWARDTKLAEKMQAVRYNPRYLKSLFLPNSVFITSDLEKAVDRATVVIFAIPSHAMRTIVKETNDLLTPGQFILSLAKGIEVDTLMRMSQVIKEELPQQFRSRIGVLSGPNHAEEVGRNIPSATVVSAFSKKAAKKFQQMFMTPYFRVYTNPDIIGVETCGAVKNVIAIAAGISDGLGYGDNTKASLITRGLAEMTRLGLAMGAQPLTFAGLSGMGDLIVTCVSRYSRNRAVGEKLGKGMKLDDVLKRTRMVAEGIRTAQAAKTLADKHGVEMPITTNVAQVIYSDKDPRNCVKDLMTRGAVDEIEQIAVIDNARKKKKIRRKAKRMAKKGK